MKRIIALAFRLAAAGAVLGFALAVWAIADQDYVGQGLWRTCLWIASRGILVGYLAGGLGAVGALVIGRGLSHLGGARLEFLMRAGSRLAGLRVSRALGRAMSRRIGWALAALISFLTLALWAAGWMVANKARAEVQRGDHNVIVIGLDTVRADHTSLLSTNERERDVTPNLRELASKSILFTKAISQAPWTLPAFSSMFTGLYPEQHGAEQRWQKLPTSQLTLAEILREAGFKTLGVSSGLYVTEASGLHQGFEVFDESLAEGQLNVTSERVTDKAIRMLRRHGKEPFFLFVHYFDPHWVYHDYADYDFAKGAPEWMKELSQTLKQDKFTQQIAKMRGFSGRVLLTQEEMSFLKGLYDEEIAYTDAQVGRLLRQLSESGLDRNTLIILVADHGEELLERGELGHGASVCQEVIHVPLTVAIPGSVKREVRSLPVETRRVFTTVLEFLDIPLPRGDDFPASLLSDDPPGALVRSATHKMAIGEVGQLFKKPVDVWWTCVYDGKWKLMREHFRGRLMLFDLVNDPGERRNCAGDNPEVCKRLERELDRRDAMVKRTSPKGPVPEADPEQQRRLKSLGYL